MTGSSRRNQRGENWWILHSNWWVKAKSQPFGTGRVIIWDVTSAYRARFGFKLKFVSIYFEIAATFHLFLSLHLKVILDWESKVLKTWRNFWLTVNHSHTFLNQVCIYYKLLKLNLVISDLNQFPLEIFLLISMQLGQKHPRTAHCLILLSNSFLQVAYQQRKNFRPNSFSICFSLL